VGKGSQKERKERASYQTTCETVARGFTSSRENSFLIAVPSPWPVKGGFGGWAQTREGKRTPSVGTHGRFAIFLIWTL